MSKIQKLIKQMWFGLFNYIFFPFKSEFNVLFWLNEQNKSKGRQWFLISFMLNLFPFSIAILIEFLLNNGNVICILNNGSMPILAFSIIATNLIYLVENMPSEREIYLQLKTRTLFISICVILIASVLYIFQSNFVIYFTENQLKISLYASIALLIISVIIGKKMFLLQNRLTTDFEENFQQQLNNLNKLPSTNDISF